jgi:hypothetical protein
MFQVLLLLQITIHPLKITIRYSLLLKFVVLLQICTIINHKK